MARRASTQPAPAGLFTKSDYEALRATRRRLGDFLGLCDKASACGIDTAVYREMRDRIDADLAAIEQHFMSPPPDY